MEEKDIYDILTDEDLYKLAELNLDEDTNNKILVLLECINREYKDKALNTIVSIFNNKKLETDESLGNNNKSDYVSKLLGDI